MLQVVRNVQGRTVSKETRVRMDGLVKIMAMVSPAKGL